MAGIRKHGAHRQNLTLASAAAGAAADTQDLFPYDSFIVGTQDASQEAIYEMYLAVNAALTGVATNFASFSVQQARAGAVLNDIRLQFSAAGVTMAALTSANLAVGGGAVVPGAGTGVLTVQTGAALPWSLLPGDIIVFQRVSAGTGQATPAVGLTFGIQAKGA